MAKYSTGDNGAQAGNAVTAAVREKTAAKVAPAQDAVKGTLMLAEASPQEQAELRVFFKNLGYKVLMTENLQRAAGPLLRSTAGRRLPRDQRHFLR